MGLALISMENLAKVYLAGTVEVPALIDVNLVIESGEFLSIMGPSGSGKSTLMNILGCLDVPTSGSYFIDGQDVSQLAMDQRADLRNRKIGFVFQGFNLLPRIDAVHNVELPLIYGRVKTAQRRTSAMEALELVGLTDRAHHLPSQLSGGQQQRVAIARALVNNPDIILADEPTGNLDTRTSNEIMSVFDTLNRQRKITFILVTHDPEVGALTDRRILIRDGRIEGDDRKPRTCIDTLLRPDRN
ncbi:MAG: ABC transporter ATP-binding protein [Desulfomonile tiedjei]|uniref:ABC transporter ATP-binding protein n=1 Tax=Desulfomonile tiedjei TaxID=2358 RepID=A0A9D6V424_9BACT|nr:ABC transporter ATP-binding protein [Desulfomonile tiedjei]